MKPTCIDAFCGAGGLGLGLKKAGFDLLYSFDKDEKSVKTHKLNQKYFDHSCDIKDICELDSAKLLKSLGIKKGELALFAGGPPCQGFSIQRIGNDDDERNSLIQIYINKILEIFPKFFLLENVPGIQGKRGQELLKNALARAEVAGYFIHQKTLDAQDYGVPQRRKRVIIIGEKLEGGTPKFRYPRVRASSNTVRSAIGFLPEPPLNGTDHPEFFNHRRDKLSELNLKRIQYVKQGQGMEFLPKELRADCHKDGADKIGHRNVYGRMKWDDVAPTITARFDSFTRGLFGHPEQDRTISLREGAILQTFPLNFKFCGNKVDIARQIGNAVPPLMAEAIGKNIIKSVK